MSEDETDKPDLQAWITPEMEARVVASVLGEASPFEAAEIDREIAERPELGVFKRRIEAVHGLVREAVRAQPAGWKLSPDRRRKVIEAIGTDKQGVAAAGVVGKRPRPWYGSQPFLLGVAACLVLGLVLAGLLLPTASLVRSRHIVSKLEPADFGGTTFSESQTFAMNGAVTAGQLGLAEPSAPSAPPAQSPPTSSAMPVLSAPVAKPAPMSAEKSLERLRPQGPAMAADLAQALPAESAEQDRLSDAGLKQNELAAAMAENSKQEGEVRAFTGGWGKGAAGKSDSLAKNKEQLQLAQQIDELKPQRQEMAGYDYKDGEQAKLVAEEESTLAATQSGKENLKRSAASAVAGAMVVTGEAVGGGAGAGGSAAAALLESVARSNRALADSTRGGVARDEAKKAFDGFINYGSPIPTPDGVAVLGDIQASEQLLKESEAAQARADAPADSDKGEAVQALATRAYDIPAPLLGRLFRRDGQQAQQAASAQAEDLSSATIDHGLEQAGIEMPAGAEASYRGGRLVVRNSQENLARLEGLFEREKKALEEATESEVPAAEQPFSTFSLHVSDVSFRLAQAALAQGQRPDAESVRPEEFYNAFDYGDPAPAAGEEVGCRIEQAAHPFLQQRNLVRIAMKVAATGRGAGQPLRLTVLIDTSGSMEREDRVASVRRAMEVLASLLGPNDAVSVIGFARQPRLLADRLPGDRASEIVKLVAETPAEGGTNLEEALRLAGEIARNQRDPSAQNRIVLLTDGAANLGNANPDRLAGMIEELRQQGIAFDACGVGAEGLNDEVLEALTRKGDGRYYFLDRPEDADEGFARQLAGAFRPAAANVKLQVRFNPARVGKYRLVGFEKHRLRKEDFRNDLVDAAELAAEEAAVALYQVEVLPDGDGELGEVFVRFRDASSGGMVERSWTMAFDPQAPGFDQASPAMQLAGTAAMLAERLRGGAMAGFIDLEALAPVVNGLRGHFAHEENVAGLVAMIGQMRRMESK